MATDLLNVATPVDADTANADDDFRKTKLAFAERLVQGSKRVANITRPAPITNEPNDGKTAIGWETESPFYTESGWCTLLWSEDGATAYLRAYGASYSDATRQKAIEAVNGAKFIGTNITSGLDPGHLHTQGGVIAGRAGTILVTGYLKPTAFRWSKGTNEGTQTIKKIGVRLGSAPTGGVLGVEVRKTVGAPTNAADVYSDGVSSVLVGSVSVAAGEFEGAVTGLSVAIADGEYLTCKIVTLNGAPADMVVTMVVEG